MTGSDRKRLTEVLQGHVGRVAGDLRGQMLEKGAVRERARRLHGEEHVGEAFEVWTDLLSRRAAVLWVLKSVYVRVLEDRGLLAPGRLFDPEAQHLFERLAPNLGETAFLRWVYRDLAKPNGGLPELFAPQPAEVCAPSDALSRELLEIWRYNDPDTGHRWSFADERFDGALMGDLYQDLDPDVKARFALCQTPDFVRSFMLDRTLTPAIETFGASAVRLIDPACGSGHFLIDGLKRLVTATAEAEPAWSRSEVVGHCLGRVVGIDLNDYACALARARLVMTAAELAGVRTLAGAARFHPEVYWADGLEQVERGKDTRGQQLDLFASAGVAAPRASLTRPQVRAALRDVLKPRFHAVLANPPYITEKDEARKAYHREVVSRRRRYVSAYREYSLGSPFTERSFDLAVKGGFVGLITSNNFMKREFGKPLIEEVLASLDLTLVADTSQAFIPHHGTPTVLLFGRNRAPQGKTVRAVLGKRGEPGTPEDPAKGRVWTSIAEGWSEPGFENEFVSVADMPSEQLGRHPWTLQGGGAVGLKAEIEGALTARLGDLVESIGFMCITKQDDVFVQDASVLLRHGCEADWVRSFGMGDLVRDWAVSSGPSALFPYSSDIVCRDLSLAPGSERYLRRFRRVLEERAVFGGQTFGTSGRTWWEYGQIPVDRFRTPLSIAFAFVATHNHFVLDRGGKVFNRSAPVIKLPADATEDDHLALLGLLNSSTACFWMKQVFHCKGSQGVNEGMKAELWMQFYEHDATKLRLAPIVSAREQVPYAQRLDALARTRAERSVASILASRDWSDAASLRRLLHERRAADLRDLLLMVAVQEELDWLCYRLYGLDDSDPKRSGVLPVDQCVPVPPNWLPWSLEFAKRDRDTRAAIARGEETTEIPTAWYERHTWEPLTELPPDVPARWRTLVVERRERTRAVKALGLIEQATYKRRWYRPDYEKEEKDTLSLWLADQTEAKCRDRAAPATVEDLALALQGDPRVLSVCEVLTGRPSFLLSDLVRAALAADAVPSHPSHVYKATGLTKRTAWERTWADQRREDAGERVTPKVPPKYATADYLRPEYFRLRGKLDVPKERFIAFTEVPGRSGGDTLYGWAGWTPLQRIRALLAIDEELEDEGVPVEDRIALLDSAWRLLPDAAREDADAAHRCRAELQAFVGPDGPSAEMLKAWRKRFPPPGRGKGSAKVKVKAKVSARAKEEAHASATGKGQGRGKGKSKAKVRE